VVYATNVNFPKHTEFAVLLGIDLKEYHKLYTAKQSDIKPFTAATTDLKLFFEIPDCIIMAKNQRITSAYKLQFLRKYSILSSFKSADCFQCCFNTDILQPKQTIDQILNKMTQVIQQNKCTLPFDAS
jgi:hypothetical protein